MRGKGEDDDEAFREEMGKEERLGGAVCGGACNVGEGKYSRRNNHA